MAKKPGKKILIGFLAFFSSLLFLLGVIGIIITGTNPCLYTKCHENATCINHPFNAECVCKSGYGGNGINHCDECGLTYFQHNAKFTTGRAVSHSWPATVQIQISYTDFERLGNFSTAVTYGALCGGILINRKTVLTIASCFLTKFNYYDRAQNKTFTIKIEPNEFYPDINAIYQTFMGVDNYVYFNQDLEYMFHSGVVKIIRHENFNEETLENNIAIVKLRQEVPLSNRIQIGCLPNATSYSYPDLSFANAYIAGFSSSGSTGAAWNLQNLELDLYNYSMCSNVKPTKYKNSDFQFCAGEYNFYGNSTGFCHGDYGSAAYVYDQVNGNYKYVASGLLSYDVPCWTFHSPAIAPYIDWIKENSKY